jgi:hypothetical protein
MIKNNMKQVVKLSAFILLAIGTLGLLINEFIFDWGSAYTYWGMKKEA